MEFKDPAVKARVEQADKLTKEIFGNKVYIRGIIEFSNCCRKNCNYCGIRRGNASVVRYQMSPDEIVAKAEENLKHGIKTIVLHHLGVKGRWESCGVYGRDLCRKGTKP